MKTTKQTVVKRRILLEPNEEFRVVMRYGKSVLVRMIEVSGGHFYLYGDRSRHGRRGAIVMLDHIFGSTTETPFMPAAVVYEVERCMRAFSREAPAVREEEEAVAPSFAR